MKQCVVVDLDHTLIKRNTFVLFVFFILRKSVKRFKIRRFFLILYFLVQRKLQIISHGEFKRRFSASIKLGLSSYEVEEFCDRILCRRSQTVCALVEGFRRDGFSICLATAAPEIYVDVLAKRLKLKMWIATSSSFEDQNWYESIRDKKLQDVQALLDKKCLELSVVITDHYDDLPLLKAATKRRIVVSPSRKTLKYLRLAGFDFEIVEGG